MKINRYKIDVSVNHKAAVVADLHGRPNEKLIDALKAERPDMILIPGDLCSVVDDKDKMINPEKRARIAERQKTALEFLKTAAEIAPVFYSRGNHEWGCDDAYREKVKAAGAILIENTWVKFGDIWIGGQNSARNWGFEERIEDKKDPDIEWLKDRPNGFKILLCHHPEYYELVEHAADLIISGHAHGGQWRFFGRGVFAPGQGLFPKYSRGQYGKMIVSAGVANTVKIPRLFNPTELVIIEM